MTISPPSITIHAVQNGDVAHLESLISLYAELFPQYTRYEPLMRHRATCAPDADPHWIEHQWLVTLHGEPAAVMVFKYLRASRVGLLLDIGVRPQFRPFHGAGFTRLAHFLILRAADSLCEDAAQLGHSAPLGMLAEAPSAALVSRYLAYGFVELPVEYREPPDTPELLALQRQQPPDASDWSRMHLVFLPAALSAPSAIVPPGRTVLVTALLTEHYRLPYNHWALQRALAE